MNRVGHRGRIFVYAHSMLSATCVTVLQRLGESRKKVIMSWTKCKKSRSAGTVQTQSCTAKFSERILQCVKSARSSSFNIFACVFTKRTKQRLLTVVQRRPSFEVQRNYKSTERMPMCDARDTRCDAISLSK